MLPVRALVLAICLCLPASAPDMLLPGHTATKHELVLTWDDAVRERFVASPGRRLHGSRLLTRGEPFPFSSKYGTRIYAVPADAVLPDAKATLRESTWPSAAIPVREVASVRNGYPVTRVLTTLRVAAVRDDGLELEVIDEQRFGMFDLPIVGPIWLPLVLIAGFGFVLLRRFHAAREPAA